MNTDTLIDQQRRLHAAVVQGRDDPTLLQAAAHHEPLLRVYQHAYRGRLVAALRDNFGTLPRLMGDAAFDALAEAYLDTHPPHQPSIRWFGDRLAGFMDTRDDLVPHPAMTDLARMEWALRTAFDAPDAAPLEASALGAVAPDDWPRLVFGLHPSLQRVPLQWQIGPAWHALQAEGDEEPQLDAPEPGEHLLLVWRPVLETKWRSATSALEAALLNAVTADQPFAVLCETAAAHVGADDAPLAAIHALQQWLGEGLLASCTLAPA